MLLFSIKDASTVCGEVAQLMREGDMTNAQSSEARNTLKMTSFILTWIVLDQETEAAKATPSLAAATQGVSRLCRHSTYNIDMHARQAKERKAPRLSVVGVGQTIGREHSLSCMISLQWTFAHSGPWPALKNSSQRKSPLQHIVSYHIISLGCLAERLI